MTLCVFTRPALLSSNYLRLIRLGGVLLVWLVLLFFLQRRYALLSRFLTEKSTSSNLAVARMVVMITLLCQVSLLHIDRLASLDHALLVPFLGWGRLAVRLPLSHHFFNIVYACFLLVTCCALAGLWTRWACALTGVCSLYLLCIPQLTGKVDHDYGHLAIFPFILALAPSGAGLSVDAFLRGRRLSDPGFWLRPQRARVYATALQAMMAYMGLAYFFPGFWKLVSFGTEWFQPAHLHYTISEMWDGIGMNPFQLWFLNHSSLLFVGATVTILLELGFLLAILSPRARPYLILVGVPFHDLTWLLMGIPFAALQGMYLILLDWSPLFARLAEMQSAGSLPSGQVEARRPSFALRGFCALVLVGMVVVGFERKMNSWPISCFPTFDWPQPPTMEIRTLQAIDINGNSHTWTLSFDPMMREQYGKERWKAMVRYDFGLAPADQERKRAAIRLWLANHPSPMLVSGSVVSSVYFRNSSMKDLKFVSSRVLEEFSAEDFGEIYAKSR